MKLKQLVAAYSVIDDLSKKHYTSFATLHDIVKFKKAVDEEVKFFVEQEKALADKYGARDENGNLKLINGQQLSFDSIDNRNIFEKEHTNLAETNVDILPITVKVSAFKSSDDYPTPAALMVLDGIIDFVE